MKKSGRVFLLVFSCLFLAGIPASAEMTMTFFDESGVTLQAARQVEVITTPALYRAVTSPQATGILVLNSIPPGASVYIDGTSRGTTPFTFATLSAGSHTVDLKMTGFYDYTRPVTIAAGGQVQETWNLVPVTPLPTTATGRMRTTTTQASSGFSDSLRKLTTTTTPVPSGNSRSMADRSDLYIISADTGSNFTLLSDTNTSRAASQARVMKNASSMEALVALRMAVGKIPYSPSYDLNHDGVVNSVDAREILILSVQGTQGG